MARDRCLLSQMAALLRPAAAGLSRPLSPVLNSAGPPTSGQDREAKTRINKESESNGQNFTVTVATDFFAVLLQFGCIFRWRLLH